MARPIFALDTKLNVAQQLESAVKEIGLLQSDVQAAETLSTEAGTKQSDLQAKVTALETQAKEKDAKIVTLETDLAAEKALNKKAEDRAVEIAASAGVPPLPAVASANAAKEPKGSDELMAAYQKLEDPKARADFYAKHSKEMFAR